MIYFALNTIKERLNQHLKKYFGSGEDPVILTNIVDMSGGVSQKINNKIIISLANVKRETTAGKNANSYSSNFNKAALKPPPLHLNLYVLISACFSDNNYEESLKYLSVVLAFFQSNQILNRQNTPDLDPQIKKLTMEIVDLDLQGLNQLWAVFGSKYFPSVLYKIRMLTIDSGEIIEELPITKGNNVGMNSI